MKKYRGDLFHVSDSEDFFNSDQRLSSNSNASVSANSKTLPATGMFSTMSYKPDVLNSYRENNIETPWYDSAWLKIIGAILTLIGMFLLIKKLF